MKDGLMVAGPADIGKISSARDYLNHVSGRRKMAVLLSWVTLASVLAVPSTPVAEADSAIDLKSAVDGARGRCPALQQDPTLDSVAARANSETNAYIQHTAKFVPFEDALPVLRELGYPASKAKLLAGYGNIGAKAVQGVVSQGFLAIPDCSYSKYGLNTFESGDGNYSLAAVVLAGS